MTITAPLARPMDVARTRLNGSIKGRLRLILGALLAIQLALVVALVASTIATQRGVSSLLGERIQPISELQAVSDGHAEALAIANKVRSGNMSASSGVGAIEAATASADRAWRAFEQHPLGDRYGQAVTRIAEARRNADRTTARLLTMLRAGQTDNLDMFVSGPLHAAVDPLTIAGRALAEALRADAAAEVDALGRGFLIAYIVVFALTALAVLVGLWGARSAEATIARPLEGIAGATRAIGLADDGGEIPGLDRLDEIGDLARALLFARERAGEARRLEDAKRRVEADLRATDDAAMAARERRATELDKLFQRFERDIGQVVATLAKAGADLRGTAAAVSGEASASETFALNAAALADQTAASVNTVLDAGRALADAIERIRDSANEARSNAQTVREQASASKMRATALAALVAEIGGVLNLISGVARQTNLLALNASIEASRAGSAGAGFAVVADEVKALARQTQGAAATISERLGAVDKTAREALDSANLLDGLVAGLDQSTEMIAQAARAQTAASREIANSIGFVDGGSRETAANMVDLKRRAELARRTAADLSATADGVAIQTEQLSREIARMVESVKAV